MNTTVTEVAPDVFRLCTYVPNIDLQFSQFLVRDDEPLLYHTGMKSLFPSVKDALAGLVDPSSIRWIGFSHFEGDECGSLNEWLAVAPRAQALCGMVCAGVNINEYAIRPPRVLSPNEVLETGRRRFSYCRTPHLPHGWDAGMLFEQTTRALFCSDLLHQGGEREPVCESLEVVDRFRNTLVQGNAGPLANYLPYTAASARLLEGLAALEPQALLGMHGSCYRGDGAGALRGVNEVMREVAVAP